MPLKCAPQVSHSVLDGDALCGRDRRDFGVVSEVLMWGGNTGEIGDRTFAWRAKAASKDGFGATG
jgi:hypothetical protein